MAGHSKALLGVVCSAAALAAVTVTVALLDGFVPVLSLAVLYVLAVLPIAVFWGMRYALPVSVAGMLIFNFFFLPPVHTLSMADSSNWLALGVFVATAAVVSELAARSRRRADESALLAEIASSLLEHGNVSAELERIAAETARALRVERTRIDLDPTASLSGSERYELTAGGRRVGMLALEGSRQGSEAARRRLLPALASLLGVAIDRERLAQDALETEALRRSDVIKTALLRAVSHDLRTPLMAIATSASTLAHADFDLPAREQQELLATILGESRRLDRLVGNLLDLSRLQAGAARPEPDLWAVDELVVQALDGLDAAADRVEVSLPEESLAVRVDADQVQRVLANLIENALKYSPSGEPVRVQVSGTGSEIVVRVIDHGPGIPAAELEQVFEPFHRGSGKRGPARRRPRARHRARLRRGERRARLGRVAGRSGRELRARPPGCRSGRSRRVTKARILVVDDEPQILRALQAGLRGAGYEVETAATAEAALLAAGMRPPDAVILDLVLPDGSGTEVARELRTWTSAPVIVLSAVGEEREKVAALDAGADDYVTKPVGIDELLARLRAVLRRAGPSLEPVIAIGELEVDLEKREARLAGRPVHLTPHQFELLRVFAAQRRQAADAPDAPPGGLGARLRR